MTFLPDFEGGSLGQINAFLNQGCKAPQSAREGKHSRIHPTSGEIETEAGGRAGRKEAGYRRSVPGDRFFPNNLIAFCLLFSVPFSFWILLCSSPFSPSLRRGLVRHKYMNLVFPRLSSHESPELQLYGALTRSTLFPRFCTR